MTVVAIIIILYCVQLSFEMMLLDIGPSKAVHKVNAGALEPKQCGEENITDISCYKMYTSNDFEAADHENFNDTEKNIFFIEPSCKMDLNLPQLCSIESAAKANPQWQVNVLFAGPVDEKCQSNDKFTLLKTYKNIKLHRIHVSHFVKNTTFESFFKYNALAQSKYPVYHSLDILKYITLWKWGGIYMDTDMIVAKSFDSLAYNWIAREQDDELGTSIIALFKDKVGRKISEDILKYLEKNFCFTKYCANGFGAVINVLKNSCNIADITTFNESEHCPGFKIHDAKYFYPLESTIEHESQRNVNESNLPCNATTYHVWKTLLPDHNYKKNLFYAQLTENYCPKTSELMDNSNATENEPVSSTTNKTLVNLYTFKIRRPMPLIIEPLAEPLVLDVKKESIDNEKKHKYKNHSHKKHSDKKRKKQKKNHTGNLKDRAIKKNIKDNELSLQRLFYFLPGDENFTNYYYTSKSKYNDTEDIDSFMNIQYDFGFYPGLNLPSDAHPYDIQYN